MIIDANNLIVGRMATVVAKKALLGEKVEIINCEKAVITGKKAKILEGFKKKREMGTYKGPIFHRNPEKLLKRMIRGMLPYKKNKGKNAFKRIKCYVGVPAKFRNKKAEKIKEAHFSKVPLLKYVKIGDVCKEIGGRIK